MTEMQPTPAFSLAYVPGVTPGKWVRVWEERLPDVPLTLLSVAAADGVQALQDGTADAGLVRLPVDRSAFSAIPLYSETTVVVIPKDHWLAAADEVTVEDLAEEIVWHPMDETIEWEDRPGLPANERPATTADAVELVAANVGLLVVPQSLARLHHRRDLTYRPLVDVPQSQVALAWLQDRTTDLVEEFIGIVRGRTVNSSRGRAQSAAAQPKNQSAAAQPKQQPGGRPAKPAAGRTAGGRPRGKSGAPGRGKPRRRG